MKEIVVKLWGAIGYAIAVVGAIFSLFLSGFGEDDFNFIVLLVGLVATAVLTLIPFTVSVVLEQLDRLKSIDEAVTNINRKVSGGLVKGMEETNMQSRKESSLRGQFGNQSKKGNPVDQKNGSSGISTRRRALDIQNGEFIEYKGACYYWEQALSNYSDTVYCHRIWGTSFSILDQPACLVKLSADGVRTELLQINGGGGELYCMNSVLYFTYGNRLGSCKTDGQNFVSYGIGKWIGIDRAAGELYACDANGENYFKISRNGKTNLDVKAEKGDSKNILCVENGIAIYEKRKNGRKKENPEQLEIGYHDFATKEDEIVFCDDEIEQICGSHGTGIVNTTICGRYLYFLYGGYSGNANIFYGGRIARLNLDTLETEGLVDETIDENFSVIENEEGLYLYYSAGDTMKRLDLNTQEVTIVNSGAVSELDGVIEETVDGAAVWYEYDGQAGVRQVLLTSDEYAQSNPTDRDRPELAAGERYLAVKNVTSTDSYVYYELFLVESEGGDSVWYNDTLKGIGAFRKNKQDGIMTKLYTSR